MELLEMFWKLDIVRTQLYWIGFVIISCCVIYYISKQRVQVQEKDKITNENKNTKITPLPGKENYLLEKNYLNYKKLSNPTKCQSEYIKCVEENATTQIMDLHCYPCQPNGDFPSRVYSPMINKWFKLDPKTGELINHNTPL